KLWRRDGGDRAFKTIDLKAEFQSNDEEDVDPNETAGLSFSPNGQTIAAVKGNTVKLWSLDGQPLKSFHENGNRLTGLNWSPDGQTIATVAQVDVIKLWHPEDRKDTETLPPKILKGHKDRVTVLSFSPDGGLLASASEDKTVKLWSRDGNLIKTTTSIEQAKAVTSVSFSPDSQLIATASKDRTVKLWNRDGTPHSSKPLLHSDEVNDVRFSPDGQLIATASNDDTLKLWKLDGTPLNTLKGHSNNVLSISFSRDSKFIASASEREVILWNRHGNSPLKIYSNFGMRKVSFSPDGKTIAALALPGNFNSSVSVWSFELDKLLERGCNQVRDYLKRNPNVKQSDRHLCDGIGE
ncbi:MAG TPA: hypothetical protein DC064_19235, partial [Cyanobacteria bacterium UBA9273]|nr:hypothetical protein [Cyanobacteria bacterium UBA9273]